jgi:hypothetical protein
MNVKTDTDKTNRLKELEEKELSPRYYTIFMPHKLTAHDKRRCIFDTYTDNVEYTNRMVKVSKTIHNTHEFKVNIEISKYYTDTELVLEILYLSTYDLSSRKIKLIVTDSICNLYSFNKKTSSWEISELDEEFITDLDKIKLSDDLYILFVKLVFNFMDNYRFNIDTDTDLVKHKTLLEFYLVLKTLYTNPAMALVFSFFKKNIIEICILNLNRDLVYFIYNTMVLSRNTTKYKIRPDIINRFDYSATNVKDFLRCSKGTYKWLRNNNISIIGLFHIVNYYIQMNKNWELVKEMYYKESLSRRGALFIYSLRTNDNNEREYFYKFFKYLKKNDPIQYSKFYYNDYLDYLRMCFRLNVEPRTNLNVKSFYDVHDELSSRIKISADKEKTEKFIKINAYLNKNYAMQIGDYYMSFPKTPEDLAREGQRQSHCVATYFEYVINKRCIIAYMRKMDDKNTPFITIEFNYLLTEIKQVRGKANRLPNKQEDIIVCKWLSEIKSKEN